MPSSFTPSLRLTLPADGELVGTWGQVVNNGVTSLEEAAIAGTAVINMTDANKTLTVANGAADEARNMIVVFFGAITAQRDIIIPSVSKLYLIRNFTTGGFGLNVKTAAVGATTVVPINQNMLLYCDGTHVVPAISTLGGGGTSLVGDGSAAAPAYSFASDQNIGMYRPSEDVLAFSTGGVQRFNFGVDGRAMFLPATGGSPTMLAYAGVGGFTFDILGAAAGTEPTIMRFLNNGYSSERLRIFADSAAGFIGTIANIPFQVYVANNLRLAFDAAGSAANFTTTYVQGFNFYVGTTTAGAGTMGMPGGVGSNIVARGNTAAGTGRLELNTGISLAMLLLPVAGAINFFTAVQSAGSSALQLVYDGSGGNVGCNFISRGVGQHAFWSEYGGARAQFVINPVPGADRYIVVSGSVGPNNPTFADSFAAGIRFGNSPIEVVGAGRPWTGAITESKSYMYNIALGLSNFGAAANRRIHEFYKDATGLHGLWISDNGGAANGWIQVVGGQDIGTQYIQFISNGYSMGLFTPTGFSVGSQSPIASIHAIGAGQANAGGTIFDYPAGAGATLYLNDTGQAAFNGGCIMLGGFATVNPNKHFASIKAGILDASVNTAGDLFFSVKNSSADTGSTQALRIAMNHKLYDLSNRELGLRDLIDRGGPGNNYTLVLEDRAGILTAIAGVANYNVPANVFSRGAVVTILNATGGVMTLTGTGGMVLKMAGTTVSGTRTLAALALVTLYFDHGTSCVVTGPGLT